MDEEERQYTLGKHQEQDPQDFENISREVRERQSPSVGEEGTEEDRRQWERTRDLREEAEQVTEKADRAHRGEQDRDHAQG